MSKDELLLTIFDSAYAAMNALAEFLEKVDSSYKDESRGHYQGLYVIGNRIVES